MTAETDPGEDSPVRAVYVVLTHRDWAQVRRLADAILRSSPDSRILVAHDGREEKFPSTVDDERIVVFPHSLRSDWGSWEIVEATLRAFARARELFDPQLVALITGSDYPVRPLSQWEAEAVAADGWVGSANALDFSPHWGRRRGEGDDRYTRYAFRWFRPVWAKRAERAPKWWARVRHGIALRLEPVFGVRYVTRGRGLHYGFARLPRVTGPREPYYFGSQLLAVRRAELDRLLDVDFAARSRLRRLYRRTVIADESALQTALARRGRPGHLPPVSFAEWDPDADRPVTLRLEDFDRIRSSGSPFCRKMDPVQSARLMDAFDEVI